MRLFQANENGAYPASQELPDTAPRRPGLRSGLRAGLVALVAGLALLGTLVVAYELALARVPEHRAALERLVRAQTGLDVRFNELGLRWGWYGPEAVFRRVELAEPGRSNVILRAPQLIVGFDAWRTLQRGQLSAGRVTLIAPDLDLARLPRGTSTGKLNASGASAAGQGPMRILERWRGGRIDIQGGTLRLPDPGGSSSPLTVQVRRLSLRRSENDWNGFGLIVLPERLGRAARVAVQLRGDLERLQTLSGAVRFEGMHLVFPAWRQMLIDRSALAHSLPIAGAGDVTVHLTMQSGRIKKANGHIRAEDVTFGSPPWIREVEGVATHDVLNLDSVSADWRFASLGTGSHLQLEQVVLSRASKDSPLPRISLELADNHIHGSIGRMPLRDAAALVRWLQPDLVPSGIELRGEATEVDFDWNTARPEGDRLAAAAQLEDVALASVSGSFVLSGLRARLVGSESRVAIELAAPDTRLELQSLPEHPFEGVKLASVLQLTPGATGWQLSTSELDIEHDIGRFTLSGTLSGTSSETTPSVDVRGAIVQADAAKLHERLGEAAPRVFGETLSRLSAARIEDAQFELNGPLDDGFTKHFRGSLALRDVSFAADGPWPATHAAAATLDWSGPRVNALIDSGRAGIFDVEALEVDWDAAGAKPTRIVGRARARLEGALIWLREHPDLRAQLPYAQDLDASGEALFDFDFSIPPRSADASEGTSPQMRMRLDAMLDGVKLRPGSGLPPIEALRGTLSFDAGHLERSTLTASWLGGPVTLKISERRDQGRSVVAVQAQGFAAAANLVALSNLRGLPEVSGETAWNGELLYTPATPEQPALWRARADSSLLGVLSELPAPFAKRPESTLPLHLEISGSGTTSELHAALATRLRSVFALNLDELGNWQIERGAVRLGGGPPVLPEDPVLVIDGHMTHLDVTKYLLALQQIGNGAGAIPARLNLSAGELSFGGGNRSYANVTLQVEPTSNGSALRVRSVSLGELSGALIASASGLSLRDVVWAKEAATGSGSVQCAADLLTCEARFELTTGAAARALADLGFRPDLVAAKGSLRGEISWQPRSERRWLETLAGHLSMRFDDGIARGAVNAPGQPLALLTVPALLSGMSARENDAQAPSGELHFRRLTAGFELRDGYAYTADLHFDGDAEILMRGRTGLIDHDYDYEAWVLRGEERIPASLRRLVATPRVAAAWMALRGLIRGGEAERQSNVVVHLRGSWSEPVVTVE